MICRSRIADITFEQIIEELGKTIQHHASIMKAISLEKKNIVMAKQKVAHLISMMLKDVSLSRKREYSNDLVYGIKLTN